PDTRRTSSVTVTVGFAAVRWDEPPLLAGPAHAQGVAPPGKAQLRGARPAADIENQLMRLRRDSCGEEHRIDRDAIARRRLLQANAAAEQTILGKRRLLRYGLAHLAASPAAARIDQASR